MTENGIDGLTLDQMTIFVAVVEAGSFSGAARRMNRAQSAVTYGIQNLELRTGVALFDRSAYRPTLTPAGIALLPRARRVLDSLVDYRKQAHNLSAGRESRIALVVDIAAPPDLTINALLAFAETFPMVEVSITTQPMEQTLALLTGGSADLAIIVETSSPGPLEAFQRILCGTFQFIAVAAPTHALTKMAGPIPETALRDHMQLILSSGTEITGTDDLSAHAINRWRVNDLRLRHRMLLSGLGWGGMPDHMIAEDLKAGRLVALHLDPADSGLLWPRLTVSAAHLKSRLLGPAGRWLLERLAKDALG